jgi:hypothetical protein
MITAKIIADSVSPTGIRMTSLEIEYPRFILAELNTHRMLSKNSSSSRAIPVKTMLQHIKDAPAMPVHWGTNIPGMSAGEELQGTDLEHAKYLWVEAANSAASISNKLQDLLLAKQVTNRITEPWMTMKTVISATEWANFFYLRNHKDAQPEIRELAKVMYEAMLTSYPKELLPGEWHLPYVHLCKGILGEAFYRDDFGTEMSLEDARIISASCCAQVSYRKNDDSLSKAYKIFDKLINSKPAHSSPTEHQATPMQNTLHPFEQSGVTHVDQNNQHWSGNLRGWVQFRKLIPNEAVWGVTPSNMLPKEELDSV